MIIYDIIIEVFIGATIFEWIFRNPLDPDQVKEVRKQYLSIIRQWIADANQSTISDRQL